MRSFFSTSFEKMDMAFYNSFTTWMGSLRHPDGKLKCKARFDSNTIGKHIKDLKAILHLAYRNEVLTNDRFKYWPVTNWMKQFGSLKERREHKKIYAKLSNEIQPFLRFTVWNLDGNNFEELGRMHGFYTLLSEVIHSHDWNSVTKNSASVTNSNSIPLKIVQDLRKKLIAHKVFSKYLTSSVRRDRELSEAKTLVRLFEGKDFFYHAPKPCQRGLLNVL